MTTPHSNPESHEEAFDWQEPPAKAVRIAVLTTAAFLGVLAIGVVMSARRERAKQAELEASRAATAGAAATAPEIAAVHGAPAQYSRSIELTGNLDPIEAADLSFTLGGRVARVLVSMGNSVRAGSPLVTLDRRTVGGQVATTEAAIGVAEANLVMLRDQVETLRRLSQSGAAPSRQLTTAEQQLAVAEAQLMQARSGRHQVGVAVADHTLLAPFAGTVTRVPQGTGVMAAPGMPIARIEDLTRMKLRTSVGEADIARLSIGDEVRLVGSDRVGHVMSMVRSLDPQTRRAPIEVVFDNADGALVAHTFVRARAVAGEAQDALRLPATTRRPNGSVFVVLPNGRVESRQVDAYADPTDGTWLVLRGLDAADNVVLRPAQTTEGVTVRIAGRAQSTATNATHAAPAGAAAGH